MTALDGNVVDQNGVPVEGALVYIYDQDGDLAELTDALGQPADNPQVSGQNGYWQANVAEEGFYTARYYWGGRLRRIDANILAGRDPVRQAQDEAHRSQDAADFAEGFTGPVYASVSAGEAATTPGQIFRVSNGDGPPETTTAYRRTAGGSVAQSPLATTAALASPEPGKGADIPAWKQTGDDSATLTAAKKLWQLPVSPDDKGADPNGVNDSTAAFQAAMAQYGEPADLTDLNGIGAVTLRPGGVYLLSGTVFVPPGINIIGNGAIIKPHPDADINDFLDGHMFAVNINESGNQVIEGGGFPLPTFSGLRFDNLDGSYNPVLVGLKAFDVKTHVRLFDVQAHGMYGLLTKNASGSADNNYVDNVSLERIYIRRAQGTDWQVAIQTQGDNLNIHGFTMAQQGNRNGIYISRNFGGKLSLLINANVLIERSHAISIEGVHNELGYHEYRNSDVKLSASQFWHRPESQQVLDPVSGADLGFSCPIRHVRLFNSAYPGLLTMENVEIGMHREHLPAEATADDFTDLLLEAQANASITNFYRFALTDGFDMNRTAAKIARYSAGTSDGGVPPAMWENVSHFAAKKSYFASNRLTIQNSEADIPASYAALSGSTASSTIGDFLEASDTYYYRAVILHGPKDRLIARATAEFSVAASQGGNAVFINGSNTNAGARPGFTNTVMRIYRGTATGTYDKVVDVPVMDRLTVVDRGFTLASGEVWKDRSPGDIDSFNTSSTFTRVEVPNDINCTLYGTTTLPTVGAWVARDRFIGTKFEAVYTGSAWAPVAGPVETSISATPAYIGQRAVVGGIAYVAVGTSSSGDWKAMTA